MQYIIRQQLIADRAIYEARTQTAMLHDEIAIAEQTMRQLGQQQQHVHRVTSKARDECQRRQHAEDREVQWTAELQRLRAQLDETQEEVIVATTTISQLSEMLIRARVVPRDFEAPTIGRRSMESKAAVMANTQQPLAAKTAQRTASAMPELHSSPATVDDSPNSKAPLRLNTIQFSHTLPALGLATPIRHDDLMQIDVDRPATTDGLLRSARHPAKARAPVEQHPKLPRQLLQPSASVDANDATDAINKWLQRASDARQQFNQTLITQQLPFFPNRLVTKRPTSRQALY